MKNKISITIILILITTLIIGCNNNTVSIDKDSVNEQPISKLKAIDCLPEQRNVDACIEIYQPVCGQMQVECITEPCDPIKETFENSCKACANPRVISYTQGECLNNNEIKY
jgi:hypothetical protein